MKFGIVQNAEVISIKTSTYNLTANDSGSVYSNEGAGSSVTFNLPTPIVGLTYSFIVEDADGITVVADATSTIRIGTSTTTNIASSTQGDSIVLVAVSTTEWLATRKSGTFQGPGLGSGYFAGGVQSGLNGTNTIQKLVSDTSCSLITATLSTSRFDGAGAVIASSIYFAGTDTNLSPGNRIDKLVSDSSCSSVSATLSNTRMKHSSNVLSASAYFGGIDTSGSPSFLCENRIDKLTNDTTCASVTATLSVSFSYRGSATITTSAYWAGGYNGFYSSVIDKLTNDTTCGAVAATLSQSNSYLTGTTLSSSAYFAGGMPGPSGGWTNRIDKLTNDATCASVTATLSTTGRLNVSALTMNSAAYFAGGYRASWYNIIDKLTNDTTLTTISATLAISKEAMGTATANF